MKYIFAFFLLVYLGCPPCFSQLHQLKLDKIDADNGLPDNTVGRVVQDNYGYIWMATGSGIVRYDGYKPHVYQLPSDEHKHNSVYVFDIFEDAQHQIWACTALGGIFRYNRAADKFIQYNHNEHNPNSLPYTNVLNAYQGNGNDMWVVTFLRAEAYHTQALSLFDTKINGFVNYGFAQKGKYHFNDKLISSVFKDNRGALLILTETGIYRLNNNTRQFVKITAGVGIDFKNYNHIYQAPDDKANIWLTSYDTGLLKLNIDNMTFKLFKHSANPKSLPDDTIRGFIVDKQQQIWVNAPGGVALLNAQTGECVKYPMIGNDSLKINPTFVRYKFDGDKNILLLGPEYLASFNVVTRTYKYYAIEIDDNGAARNFRYNVMVDRSQNIWLTNGSGGAGRVNTLRTAFNFIKINQKQNGFSDISDFLEKSYNECYLATSNGLYIYNLNNNHYNRVAAAKGFDYNVLFALARNNTGLMALGVSNGVGIYNPLTNTFKLYKNDPHNPQSFNGEDSRAIVADSSGNFWIGTGDMGVTLFNPKTNKFRPFPFNKDISSKSPNPKWLDDKAANFMYRDKSGTIWVGTFRGGINRFNPKDSSFTSYIRENRDLTDINGIYEDSKKRFWVATGLNGLFLFDRQRGKVIKQYTDVEGLLSNKISSVTEDNQGRIWATSSLGISVVDPVTNKIIVYNKLNALPDDDPTSPYRMPGGKMLYSTSKGIISLNFDEIITNPYPPQVYIENIVHSNPTSAKPKTDTLFSLSNKQLVLPYNQNQVTFNFIALHYSNPAENEYLYQLENFDKKWISTKTQRSVTYNNLSPGTYTFRVKAANSDGVWNTKGDTFVLTITAPLWLRWWAWVLYAGVFITALRAYLKYRSRRLLLENQLLEEKITLRTRELSLANAELNEQREEITAQRDQVTGTLKELEQTQNQLIQAEKMASMGELTAGIAHEIQNPLNFVNNFSEVSIELISEMEEELAKGDTEEVGFIAADIKQNLQKINHHGKRADGIVKAMLQHSRASGGVKEPTDLNKIADEYLRLAYHGLRAKDKTFNAAPIAIGMITNYDSELPLISIIPQDMGRVLLNLYNNAFYAVQQKQKTAGENYKPTVEVNTTLYTPPPGSEGRGVRLTVRDNGTGIPDAIKNKILQPFFTTKPTGEGTGLGLSISYDIIVKSHGGQLEIDSVEGEFTEFTITLPMGRS